MPGRRKSRGAVSARRISQRGWFIGPDHRPSPITGVAAVRIQRRSSASSSAFRLFSSTAVTLRRRTSRTSAGFRE